jgi:hypothetical protein
MLLVARVLRDVNHEYRDTACLQDVMADAPEQK